MSKRNLQHYLKLPYRMNLTFDEESKAWIVRYPELPGCIAHGETTEEALAEGEEAKALWIETALGENHPIPEPLAEPAYSGKFVLRLPRSLHEAAAESADREGVSLNSYLVHLVSEGVQRTGLKNLYGLIEGRLQTAFSGLDFQKEAPNFEASVNRSLRQSVRTGAGIARKRREPRTTG